MSIPLPPIELEGHCSTIYDNTLYVLSPGGFQSLPLKKRATWTKETSGVAVTGPACVITYPDGSTSQAQLWVIGGTSSDTSYTGLQVYSFADKSWQTVSSPVPVMQGRTNHSAAYLQDLQSILIYAGSQQSAPSFLSSETFVLSTQAPYGIQAFTSNAPPANIPILQPWDSGSVVMVGGSVLNTQISIFSPQGGWQFLSTQLVTPLNPSARGTLIQASDGSKVLEVYDANVSPNDVFQVVLLGAGGAAAYTGEPVGNSSTSKLVRRDLTLNDWPPYQSKNAPVAIRTDFSVSQSLNGLAVLAGGNSKIPVAIFNQDRNSWVDAEQFFGAQHQHPLKPTHTKTTSRHSTAKPTHNTSPTTSHSHTATAAASPSSKAAAHDKMLRTLGIILGVLCGIAVIFIAILVFLRWRKLKKRKQEGWLDEKNAQHMSFQDRGTPSYINDNGGANNPQALPNNPFRQSKNASQSSLGMITGKINKRLSNKRLTGSHVQKNSFDSTSRLVAGGTAAAAAAVELADIEKPPPSRKMTPREERSDRPPTGQYGPTLTAQDARNLTEGPEGRANRNRSSGWSKYFATSTPTGPNGLSHLPSAYVKTTMMSDASVYSNAEGVSQHTRVPSTTLGPALVDFKQSVDGQPVSHVASRSPLINDSREDFARGGSSTAPEGQKGLIVDPDSRRSQSDSISTYDQSATTSARTSEYYNDSGPAPWSPTHNSFKEHLNSRPPSNTYDSDRRIPSRGKNSHFFPGPGDGVSYRRPRTPKTKSTQSALTQQSDDRDSNLTMWPKYIPSAHYSKPVEEQLATADSEWPVPPKGRTGSMAPQADGRNSNVTIFPKGPSSAYYGTREQDEEQAVSPISRTSDLGWVKLGLNGSQTRL